MTDARERWTLVTGASGGIGEAMARILAERGRPLVLAARRKERLDALAAEITGRHGVAAHAIAADLERPDAPDALLDEVERRGVALHTLINNAGFGQRGRFDRLPAADQAAMVELNVTALTKLCRRVMPGLIARRAGGILNVGSVAGFLPGPNMAVYYATKAYVLSLSEALHEEGKPFGVTVTVLCPGSTETEFSRRADVEMSRRMRVGAMSAEAVARLGLDGYERGEAVVVTGAANRVAAAALKLMPRRLVRSVARRLQG